MERMIRVVRGNGEEVVRYRIELFHYRALSPQDFAAEAARRLRTDRLIAEDETSELDYQILAEYSAA